MDAVRPLRTPTVTLAAALAAGALIGAGGGAATYAALSSGNGSTVVRQVTVSDAQPASSDGNLSVQSIYRLANKGVVEITAGQGQGSGFVYDADGHIITNEHVVAGSSSVSVKFWNGKTFTASVVGTDASTDLAVLKVDAPVSQLFPSHSATRAISSSATRSSPSAARSGSKERSRPESSAHCTGR